ncbi:MAG: mechanosensitive ion channel family protein [Calditrichaceae bacterium]|nr:mechanosensitive ion channel family protein [Calditrichaceae bacterium]
MEFLDTIYFNNPLKQWLIAIAVLVISFIVIKIVLSFVKNRLKKISVRTASQVDDVVVIVLEKTSSLLILILSVFIGSQFISLIPLITTIILNALILVFLIQAAIWGNAIITFYVTDYTNKKRESDAAAATTMSAVSFVGKMALYAGLVIIALDNLGFDITTLIAGLGVGGIAIALAVQNILSDLFASLSIVLDKPFVIGDFIIINEYMGTVEHVGLKTTRIRSLSGEQLVISNNDLLSSRIRNYKRMQERRIVFTIGVIYQTTKAQLEKIPTIIKDIIDKQELARFDRSHFKNFGDFSLNFETVFWVESADYNQYMDIQQSINLKIMAKFQEEKIEFAYPTQVVYVEKTNSVK